MRVDARRIALAASILALALTPLAFCLAPLLAQRVYVDEHGLLAGQAATTVGQPSPAGRSSLVARMRALGLEPRVHAVRTDSANCSCAAVSGVVRARRGDGAEAVLLSVRAGATDAAAARADRRGPALVLALAAHLQRVPWLAKDVVLLFAPCCACAAGARRGGGAERCSRAALSSFLDDHALLPALAPPTEAGAVAWRAALRASRGGTLRQVLSIDLGGERRPSALRVAVDGCDGRLPNLDMYAAVWRVATRSSVPLRLAGDGPPRRRRGAAAEAGMAAALGRRAAAAWRLAEVVGALAWGDGDGEHAEALRRGIDALSLAAVDDDDEAAAGAALSDGRLLALLEGLVRALSNLSEALHHSHYAYLLLTPSTFIALARSAPALHAPPLASLLLRAAAHAAAAATSLAASSEGASAADALLRSVAPPPAGAAWLAAAAAPLLLLLPPPPLAAVAAALVGVWAALAALVRLRAAPGAADVLACVACVVGAIGCAALTCASLALGLASSWALAAAAAVLLPWPR